MQEARLSSRRLFCLPILFGFICFALLPLSAQSPQAGSPLPPPAAGTVDYRTDIEPLLRSRCYLCHGEGQQINGLRLDRKTDALRGGYSGPVMLPGKSGESRLIQLVAGSDSKVVMPPVGERLTAGEVGLPAGLGSTRVFHGRMPRTRQPPKRKPRSRGIGAFSRWPAPAFRG